MNERSVFMSSSDLLTLKSRRNKSVMLITTTVTFQTTQCIQSLSALLMVEVTAFKWNAQSSNNFGSDNGIALWQPVISVRGPF